jgi:hypothetical protein
LDYYDCVRADATISTLKGDEANASIHIHAHHSITTELLQSITFPTLACVCCPSTVRQMQEVLMLAVAAKPLKATNSSAANPHTAEHTM